jgi:hypothetical protein
MKAGAEDAEDGEDEDSKWKGIVKPYSRSDGCLIA